MATRALEVCNTLWVTGNLGPVLAACLASFVAQGHRVILHCYDPPNDVPAGVETADAALIVPATRIIRHKDTGSLALFSNLFRYELLRQGRGLWIDCDLYCVRPIVQTGDYVFGWESLMKINGAVLKLPADSPALTQLIAIFDEQSPVLPWLRPHEQPIFEARKRAGERFDLSDLPWGVAGARALTHVFDAAGVSGHARQRRVFYPLAYNDGLSLLRPGDIARVVSPMTLTVHLWNEALKKCMHLCEPGSPIDRLIRTGTLFGQPRALAS